MRKTNRIITVNIAVRIYDRLFETTLHLANYFEKIVREREKVDKETIFRILCDMLCNALDEIAEYYKED